MIDSGAKLGDAKPLAMTFFSIYFLHSLLKASPADGYIIMLKRENVGLASTCNAVGQTLGFFASFTWFLVLNAREYCDLKGFVKFWSAMFFKFAMVFWKRKIWGEWRKSSE